MKIQKLYITAAIAAAAVVSACNGGAPKAPSNLPVYLDDTKPIEERIEDALSRMTTDEKVAMVHAQSKFSSPGVPSLGIPAIWCTDGPHGIRTEVLYDEWDQAGWTNDSCTAYPALTALAATWNLELSELYGKSIGEEARYRNKTVLLGPGVNIQRSPYNGRSFEYMGEDPYLSSKMVVPYIKGVQSNGVAACVKHFALNNQEINRFTTNVNVDDRTLYEIYLPAFKAAVQEGGAWTLMSAYNLYKEQFCGENQYLLDDILRGEWGFDGVVVSDWGGIHSPDGVIPHGVDIEYGSWTNGLTMGKTNAYDQYHMADAYKERLADGRADMETLDARVRRILRLEFRTNMNRERPFGQFTSDAHYAAARKIGSEGIVLLKNEGSILPINASSVKKVLVVGENAIKMMTVGGGSSSLKVKKEVSPLDGIKAKLAGKAEVSYERGYIGTTYSSYNGVTAKVDLSESRTPEKCLSDAVAAAKDADYVIYVGGLNKEEGQDCEGADRTEFNLPYGQDAVISALAKVSKNLVVINISGNPYAMPWVNEVPAIIQDWYLGSEAGNSLADVLFGDVTPSGKLPFTFPVAYEDCPIRTEAQYPGILSNATGGATDVPTRILQEQYSEGIFVGYRWYEKESIKPMFPFGYGLSYTTFEYGQAKISKTFMTASQTLTVTVPVTNTGKVAGAEIVQLYIADAEASVVRPAKELKGFDKVSLKPGETKTVSFTIDASALSFFDADKHDWVAEPGKFTAIVAASSEDIKSCVDFELK
ncbi:MAG: glycoside hydrolase family 3 C-terminal domain-containing protein [Bacteroidales bacterium]|nr:glycoside hydrolase family 3 C-terminal domain-containing protein [Bacteroidales bacterium]